MRIRKMKTSLIGLAFLTAAYAQSPSEERMRQKLVDDFAVIKRHADALYPAITRATQLPPGLVIGLVVTRDLVVLDHSVAVGWAEGVSSTDEMRVMFPGKSIAERTGGGGCFGGTKANEPKYCVVFAGLEK
jgi:hypothetical protein